MISVGASFKRRCDRRCFCTWMSLQSIWQKFFSVDDNNFNNKGQIVPIKKDGVYLRERAVASGGRWLLSSTEVNGDELGRGYLYVIETETRKITDSVLVHTLVKRRNDGQWRG